MTTTAAAVMSGRTPAGQGLCLASRWSWVRSCLRPFCAEN